MADIINGSKGRRDKTGAVRLTIPFVCSTLAEALALAPSAAQLGTSLPITDTDFEELENGAWKATFTCEGLVAEAAKNDANAIEVEFDGTMGQESVRKHPNFAGLKLSYGWTKLADGREGFPEYIAQSQLQGSTGTQSDQQVPNPFFGVESYKSVEAIFRATYTRRKVPLRVIDEVGKIVAEPYYWYLLGIKVPKGRNFLVLAPKIKKKGNVFTVTEEAQMSGPGGALRNLYNFTQLARAGRSSGVQAASGLVTDSL